MGADDISSEHYKYALDTSLPLHLSSILTLCLRYGTIPETFLHGILIPIYKKGKDPEAASSYRPVNLSVVMTKMLNLIKWSLGLSKFCRSTPLLRALGVQRIPAMRDHQSVNLLKRCLAGSYAASTFDWSLIHNRDIDVTRTLVNKLNLVDNSISRVLFGNTRRLFYDIDNDGLSDSARFFTTQHE